MQKFNLALVHNKFTSNLKRQVDTWAELVERFAAPPEVTDDREAWASTAVAENRYCLFSPSDYRLPDDPQAQRNATEYSRCNQNVEGKDLLILDIDNDIGKGRSTISLDEAKEAFAEYSYILYTSYHHRVAEHDHVDRFRIILPLSSRCDKISWMLRINRMKIIWPFADPASFTLSQPFYFPVVHPDRQLDYVFYANSGKALDWNDIEPVVTASNIERVSASQSHQPEVATSVSHILLANGDSESIYDLYQRLPDGYDHRERCFSPFRDDQHADCFVYRFGPSLCIWDNAANKIFSLPLFQSKPTQIIGDWVEKHEVRKANHLANLHTVPAPPKPSPMKASVPLVEYPSPVIRISQRYLEVPSNTAIPKKGMLFIKSPKGTGKTSVLKELMPTIKGRVLLIGHRISLLSALAKELGLKDYQVTRSARERRFAICLDSLPRLIPEPKEKEMYYDTILIDESEQVLRHLTADTLKRRRRDVINTLIRQVRLAQRIICLDADLTAELSIGVMAKLRGPEHLGTDELLGYINDFQFTGRSIEMYPSREQLLAELVTYTISQRRVFIATNHRQYAEKLAIIIQQNWPGVRIILVSSATTGDAGVKAFQQDPEGQVGLYDVVIATPSMATGVSISVEGHFAATFGFFNQRPSTYQDCDQAISRVRGNIPTKVWIQQVEHTKPPRPESFYYNLAMKRELATRIRLPDERPEFTKGELLWFDIYARLTWLEERWMHAKLEQFIDLKINSGYEVISIPPDDDAKAQGFAAQDAADYDATTKRVEEILAASDLTEDEERKISAKAVKSPAEEVMLLRCLLKSHLGSLPFNFANIRETLEKGHLRKRRNIGLMQAGLKANITRDKRERSKSKQAVTDYAHRTKEFEGFTALLEVAQIDYFKMLENVVAMLDARKRLQAAIAQEKPRSPARRAAFNAFEIETAGINLTVSKKQLLAVAQHYFKNMYDFNLFFGCRIRDPINERNQAKVWNATFGYFGLPVKSVKKGPRGAQVSVYEINYLQDGLMLKASLQ